MGRLFKRKETNLRIGLMTIKTIKMPKIRRHIPNFVDIDEEPETVEFSTTKELLEIPFVKSFSDSDFYKFSIADHPDDPLLIEEYDEGRKWYVVGHIDDISNLDLSEWEPVKN